MFGLGLTRFLPSSLRGPVRAFVEGAQRAINGALLQLRWTLRRKRDAKAYRGERVAIVGYLNAPTGLGRGARVMLAEFVDAATEARGFDVAPLLVRGRRKEARAVLDALHAYGPSDIIFHVNPPSMGSALIQLKPDLCKSAAIIAYWHWELNRLPPHWVSMLEHCDELWAPSPFVADAVRASAPRFRGAVRPRPHAVDRDPFPKNTPEGRAAARTRLALPADAFVAGMSFSMSSNFARKNPLATIAAFKQAFPAVTDDSARLLVRVMDPEDYPEGMVLLDAAARGDSRVKVLTRADASIFEFYQAIDVLMSLHRSEGYGLNIVEATQAGIDVIATAWSIGPELLEPANVYPVGSDLVDVVDPQGVYTGIRETVWAEANVTEAAAALIALREKHAVAR